MGLVPADGHICVSQGVQLITVALKQRNKAGEWPDSLQLLHPTLSELDKSIELVGSGGLCAGISAESNPGCVL